MQPLAAVLSADEVMGMLGLSPPTLRRLVKDGHLRAHRLPGGRKWVFRADEVLESVGSWPSEEEGEDQHVPSPQTAPSDDGERVDPTSVWCPTPTRADGGTTLEDYAAAWLDAARRSGLDPATVSPTEVCVYGRVYELRSGPRERVRVVDDDGEEAWQLIDAVWAELAESTES